MSFPKAKIHRFNEDISCAPPPGTYDPKLDTKKFKGTPNQKLKRKFPDQHCISTSLDSLHSKSSNTKMIFRTPQVIRKFGVTPRLKSPHSTVLDPQASLSNKRSVVDDKVFKTPMSSVDYQRLEQQWSALANKHVAEINRLKADNFRLQENLNVVEQREAAIELILEEKDALVYKVQNDLLVVNRNLDNIEDMITKERVDCSEYTKELKSEISLIKNEKENLEKIVAEKQSVIDIITNKYSNLKNEFELLDEKQEEVIEYIEEQNSKCVNKIILKSENQIEQLEQTVKNKLCRLEEEIDSVQENALVEFETKIKYLMDHKFEPKSCLFHDYVKTYHTRIEELRIFVSQKEKEYLKCIQEVDERSRLLYRELCKVETQRDELLATDLEKKLTILNLQKELDNITEDLTSYKEKCKKYEITLRTMHGTVNALSSRLLESENEVLKLNNMNFIVECEKKNLGENSLLSNIIDVSKGRRERIEVNVDHFKMEVLKNVQLLNDEIYHKQSTIDKLKKELDNLVNELNCSKINGENKIYELKSKVDELKSLLSNAEKEIQLRKNENNMLLESNGLLKNQIRSLEEVITKKNQSEVKLQQSIDELFSDLFLGKKRFESLEMEKNKVEIDLALIQTSYIKKEEEIQELDLKIKSMDRSLKNLEERVTLTDEDKAILEMQLLNAENNALELQFANGVLSKSNDELRNKISELHHLLNMAKEQVNTEIPNLEQDIINKAACILELSVNIDTLNETVNKSEDLITYLQAEKSSLIKQLFEARSQISDLECSCGEKNKIISKLSDCISCEKASFKEDCVAEKDIFNCFKRPNEVLETNLDNRIKLQAALEESGLEEEFPINNTKHERDLSETGASQMTEDLQVVQLKLQSVIEERDKLNNELIQLKHQNVEEIDMLKQGHFELKEKAKQMEIENSRLKRKLDGTKENANVPQLENSPKVVKDKMKKLPSPAVLKDKNY